MGGGENEDNRINKKEGRLGQASREDDGDVVPGGQAARLALACPSGLGQEELLPPPLLLPPYHGPVVAGPSEP